MQAETGDRTSLYCTFIVWIQCNKIYYFSSLKGNTPMLKKYTWSWCMGNQKQPPPPPPYSDSYSIFPPLLDPLILPLTLKKDTPSYTGHGFCPYIQAPSSGSPPPECMRVSSIPDPEPSGFLDWKCARICGKKSRMFAGRPPAESSSCDCNVQPAGRAPVLEAVFSTSIARQ